VDFPGNPTQVEFAVTWNSPGQFNVSFIAVDGCGNWNSFVGGGPRSF
jgi:hypothetical protein